MASNRSLEQLIEDWEPRLRKAFMDSVYALRDRVQIARIAERLEKGDVPGAIEAVGLDATSFRMFDKAIAEAFESGGGWQAGRIPATREPDGLLLKIDFDVRNPRAEGWLREHSGNLIREVTEDQRRMVRDALTAGMEAGSNPRTVALDIAGRINRATGRREGGLLGLTSTQVEWARNYARELAEGDPAALTRKLRDARFDGRVRKAIAEGRKLTADEATPIFRAYINRALRLRAETIARTEAMASLHQSSIEAMEQAIEKGQVRADAVTKVWLATRDGRTRDTHRALNGQAIGFRDVGWITSSGALLRYPGDPQAPAAETVNCRCSIRMDVDFLRGIR